MSKTTGMAGLTQGLASVVKGDAYVDRLSQFKTTPSGRGLPKFQTKKQKQRKESEEFTDLAVGAMVAPSNINMYESHYQYSKDKANILFSDEVISHFAKDKRGMAEWNLLVQELNSEIAGYEAYYEDSFGDPSTADGKGFSWADRTVREKHPGGQKGFWEDQGVEASKTAELNDVMKTVDSRQHANMKFNFETKKFDYDRIEGSDDAAATVDPFVVNPQAANELFSFQLTQSVFESPTDFAAKDTILKVIDSDEQFDIRMDRQLTKDSFRRAVADNYMNNHPGQAESIDEVMADQDMFDDAYGEFKEQTKDFAKENEKMAAQKAKKQAQSKKTTKPQPSFSNLIASGEDSTYQGTFFTQVPVPITYTTLDGTLKTEKFNNIVVDNGELALDGKDGPIPLTQGSIAAQQLDAAMGAGTFARMQYQMQTGNLSGGSGGGGGATGGVETFQDADLTYKNLVDASRYKPSKSNQHSNQNEELERLSEIVAMTETDAAEALVEMYGDEFDIQEIKPGRDYLSIGGEEISVDETDMEGQSHYENVIKLFNTLNK